MALITGTGNIARLKCQPSLRFQHWRKTARELQGKPEERERGGGNKPTQCFYVCACTLACIPWCVYVCVCVCVCAHGWLTETYLSCRLILWGPGMSDSIKAGIWLGEFDIPLESCRLSHPIEHKLASTLTNRHWAACWPLTTKHRYKSILMSSLFTKHGCLVMTYGAESVWGTLEKSLRF